MVTGFYHTRAVGCISLREYGGTARVWEALGEHAILVHGSHTRAPEYRLVREYGEVPAGRAPQPAGGPYSCRAPI